MQKKIVKVGDIDCGSDQLFLISGPCVIEDIGTMQKTAEVLKISVNTVKTHMKKAFKILRTSLKDPHLLLFLFSQKNLYR